MPSLPSLKYDVALSFAGEQRDYVGQVAEALRSLGVSVFYDAFEEDTLWGKNLYDYLHQIYSEQARFTVMFISEQYVQKRWSTHERKSAQERALRDSVEYILPARFDDAIVPGLLETTAYIDCRTRRPSQIAEMISLKLGKRSTTLDQGAPTSAKSASGLSILDAHEGLAILEATSLLLRIKGVPDPSLVPSSGVATKCPDCRTIFRVRREHLLVAEGWVRCGKCSNAFNAMEHLSTRRSET